MEGEGTRDPVFAGLAPVLKRPQDTDSTEPRGPHTPRTEKWQDPLLPTLNLLLPPPSTIAFDATSPVLPDKIYPLHRLAKFQGFLLCLL